EEIMKLGYEAAQAKATLLSTLSVDEPTWQAYLAERASRRRTTPVPQFVEVAGTDTKLEKNIESDLSSAVGKPVDPEVLQNQLTDLKGDGRFSSLSSQMSQKPVPAPATSRGNSSAGSSAGCPSCRRPLKRSTTRI